MHVGMKTLSTFTLIARSYENHCVNTIPWYEKNMLSKNFISNANGSANECNT
jgi:hypothetical protein